MKSTRRGSDSPVHRREKTPRFQIPLDKWPVSPGTPREASGVPCLNPRRGLTLLSQVCRFVSALKDNKIHNPASIGAFLSGVCNNVILEYRRRLWREGPPETETPPATPLIPPEADALELRDAVNEAL